MAECHRDLERAYRGSGSVDDLLRLRRELQRAGESWDLEHTAGVGFIPSLGEMLRFGPSQEGLRTDIAYDSLRVNNSGQSHLLHPRVVLDDRRVVYRMMGSDELMDVCGSNPALLKSVGCGASFLTKEGSSQFVLRPRCPFLWAVDANDTRELWPLAEVTAVFGSDGEYQGRQGVDYFICDRSDPRYSTESRGTVRLLFDEAMTLEGWRALAGGDVDRLERFLRVVYDRNRKYVNSLPLERRYRYDPERSAACWVREEPGLRAVAFGDLSRVADMGGGCFSSVAQSVRACLTPFPWPLGLRLD